MDLIADIPARREGFLETYLSNKRWLVMSVRIWVQVALPLLSEKLNMQASRVWGVQC